MKIFTICDYFVYNFFYKALSDVGHYVIVLDINKINKQKQYSHISNYLDELKPDIVLTIGRPEVHGLSLESLKIIHQEFEPPKLGVPSNSNGLSLEQFCHLCKIKNIPHVFWATEDRAYHYKYNIPIAHNFDLILTPSEECISDYQNIIQKPSSLLKYGCLPSIHRKVKPSSEFSSDISIVANYHQGFEHEFVQNVINNQENDNEYSLRKESIEKIVLPIIENGYDISIWGTGWEKIIPTKYIKGVLNNNNINTLYSSSKIVLGLEWDNISETKTTGRPFEVLGCGAFFLTLRTKALSNLFLDRVHLSLTNSKEETLDIIKYYLIKEDERNKIALEGQREVYSKHTYYHRVGEFINIIDFHFNKN